MIVPMKTKKSPRATERATTVTVLGDARIRQVRTKLLSLAHPLASRRRHLARES